MKPLRNSADNLWLNAWYRVRRELKNQISYQIWSQVFNKTERLISFEKEIYIKNRTIDQLKHETT